MDARTEQQVKHIPPVRWTRKTVKRYAQAYRVIYARENFARFRQYMRPNMMWGWWNQVVADELQLFYEDFRAGKRPKLALMSPPQHGKSWTATDFIAWVSGKDPTLKTIFGSYSDRLGVRTNLWLQRMMSNERYRQTFPGLTVQGLGRRTGLLCNTELIEFGRYNANGEFQATEGSFRNTTIDGPVNGMELHLGVIDDPHKGRSEANSIAQRNKVWNWFADGGREAAA